MNTDIEELRFVADLAHNEGRMQAQNEQLRDEIEQQKREIERLRSENEGLRAEVADLKAAQQQASQQPKVVVNNFYLLSVPKTFKYVSALDNDGRRFVGHFMHQTLSDTTPQSVMAQVDEMTQLEGGQEGRLADAMEELARKPTTQNNYGDTVEMKTVIPRVENYRPQIQSQNIDLSTQPLGHQDDKRLNG